ncbi:MAG TPA: PilZ domain-containing protein [Pyrinomonadaceae bacterium]|jgi:c-di-GMP-binding flagellar brake protein YcgR|nr:PilZ domain-containing protein [Pyrinomonadaceae bacterium]
MSQSFEVLNLNRRSSPRYPARLPSSLSLAARESGFGHMDRPPVIPGETLDISLEGLSLIVPSLRTERHDLTQLQNVWRIVMALPIGHVQVHALLVRFQRFRGDEMQTGYLIGLRIAEMTEADRRLFTEYVQSLQNAAPATT